MFGLLVKLRLLQSDNSVVRVVNIALDKLKGTLIYIAS